MLRDLWIRFDYGVFLPFLAFLPYRLGRGIAYLRGCAYGLIKRDWRSFTFDDNALWERTYRAYGEICPNLSHGALLELVRRRYAYQSMEEFEGALLGAKRFADIEIKYIGLEKVKERVAKNPHAVFITSHFGSSILGITFLQRLEIPLLVMSSNVVEHEKVHPALTKFFLKKYRGIDIYMNGGEVLDIEGNGKKFLSFLKKTGSLVIIADLPPNNVNETPEWKRFFGYERGFASGAKKLAESCGSEIIPFVCYFEDRGYVIKFGDERQEPYSFLEEEIGKKAEMWWAADILGLLQKKRENEQI